MRQMSDAAYARRIQNHRERAKRKAIFNMTLIACGAILIAAGLARADTNRHASAPVQHAVDVFAGRHVPRLMMQCRGPVCAAWTLAGVRVVVRHRPAGWIVTSGIVPSTHGVA